MSASNISSSQEPRAHVRCELGVSHDTFDLAEGAANELFDLGGDYRITLSCSRPEGAKHTAMVAAGSTTVTAEVFKNMEAVGGDPSKITTEGIKPFEDEVEGLVKLLTATLQRAIALARWRTGAPGLYGSTIGHKKLWSLNGDAWHDFPLGLGHTNIRAEIILKWLPDVRRSYAELLRAGVTEPTAYNLLLEALRLRDSYPRSALVIGVAALEIGVKQCIADLAPATDWLLTKHQGPPVYDLLCEYLPTLEPKVKITGGRMLKPPKSIRRIIRRAVEARNSLVHRTGEPQKDLDLEDVLKAIHDILFLLEFYQGHEWALQRMRHETQGSMMTEAGIV